MTTSSTAAASLADIKARARQKAALKQAASKSLPAYATAIWAARESKVAR